MDYNRDSLSVEEILQIPTLKNYKLLAGSDGLKNRCQHMTILETPTGISWLKGGEFLLTAGYAFLHDEFNKKNMLIGARKKGVSAIAIKENRYFGEISEELIKQANEFNIPLIQIPYEVVYTNTISSFYDKLFFKKNQYILKLNDVYEKLLNLSFENKAIDGIVYSLSSLSNSSVFLLDASFNIMCYNIINPKDFDKSSNISPFNKKGIKFIKEGKTALYNIKTNDHFISLYPITIQRQQIAFLYIINGDKLDQLTQRLMEYGASIIAMKIERDQNTSILQTKMNRTLVEIMLNNDELPNDFYKNVELNLNWDIKGYVYGICIKSYLHENCNMIEGNFILYNILSKVLRGQDYLSSDKDNEIYLFVKYNSTDDLEDMLSRLMENIKVYKDLFNVSIGIAKPYKEIKHMKKLYEESKLAALFSNDDIVYYNSLDTIKLLYPLKGDNEIEKYYERTIKNLEKYDENNGTNLMETLEFYFKYNFKKILVAEKLYIHVETLRYRLNRIEDITGYSLDDSEGMFALQMGLKLKKLIKVR